MNRSLLSFLFISVIAVAAFALVFGPLNLDFTSRLIPRAYSATGPNPLSGWAWSANIGWISFNSGDANAGGGPYNVYVADNGDIKGYAWSSNIGWIKFGDLSTTPGFTGFPVATGDAHVSTSSGAVTGWARACAGTIPGDCSSMNSRTDGWDGWIELSGANHETNVVTDGTRGVTYNPATGVFNGFAWGGEVVGWVEFSPSTAPPVVCEGDCDPTGGDTISCSLSAKPTSLLVPGDTNLTWSSQNAQNCLIDGSSVALSGTTSHFVNSDTTFNLSCQNTNLNPQFCSGMASVSVGNTVNPPEILMWLDDDVEKDKVSTRVRPGEDALVNWEYNGSGTFNACKGYIDDIAKANPLLIGNLAHPNGNAYSTTTGTGTLLPRGTHDFAMTCTGVDGDGNQISVNAENSSGGESLEIRVTSSTIEEI